MKTSETREYDNRTASEIAADFWTAYLQTARSQADYDEYRKLLNDAGIIPTLAGYRFIVK